MKTKVILVDDELSSRSNIKLLLAGNAGYELVADFADPAQALSWLGEHNAHIILSDMNMPKMNGVEFIRMALTIRPDIQIIAISGYDDFDYLRECMRLGVHDYLLKHKLSREVLINVLDSVRQKLPPALFSGTDEAVPQKSDIMRELFESHQFDGDAVRRLIVEHQIYIDTTSMVLIVINPDFEDARGADTDSYSSSATMIISDIAKQAIADSHKYMGYTTGDGNVVLLLSFANIASYQYILSVTGSIVSRIKNMTRRLLGITLSIGVGPISHSLEDLVSQFHRLNEQIQQKLYLGADRVYHVSDVPAAPFVRYFLSPELAARLEYELVSLHTADLTALLGKLFDEIKAQRSDHPSLEALCKSLVDMIRRLCPEIELSAEQTRHFEFIEQYRQFVFSAFLEADRRMTLAVSTHYSPPVAQAMAYITANYAQDISLETCAEHAGLSYTHMSRVFSRETGKRFAEYLNEVRIEKAKALLLENQHKMKEIVLLAGFKNYNYFFKVFRESEGMTPSEFLIRRKKL